MLFTPATLRFLRDLRRTNERTWFNDHKHLYEAELKAPLLTLIELVNQRLAPHAPDLLRPPAKTMLRIYRDIRFSPDKRPYKHHISAWWGPAGMSKTSGAGFYLQLSGTELLLAAGLFMPTRDQLLAMRQFLADQAPAVRTELARPRLRRLGFAPAPGQSLSRVPKGFPQDHAAADLLRQQQWGVSLTEPAETALTADFATTVSRRFLAALPLVQLLNQPFATRRPATLVSPLPSSPATGVPPAPVGLRHRRS